MEITGPIDVEFGRVVEGSYKKNTDGKAGDYERVE
jgi:hypothetical protein